MPKNRHSTQQTHPKHIVAHLHVGALLLGGTALFSKLIPFSAIDIIAYRTLICGLLLVFVAVRLKHRLVIDNKAHLLLLILCSLLFTVHWTSYFHAMQVSSVAVGIVSMFSFPVITVFIEPLINKTKLHVVDILMGLFVLVGVFLIVPEFSLENQVTAGVFFGLISALAVATRNIIVSRWLSSYSPFTIMAYHALISSVVLFPLANVSAGEISGEQWWLLILLGTVFTAVPHTQKTFGLLHESAKTVSMIISLQVVYASLFAYLILDESIGIRTVTGGSIILFAALFESIQSKKTDSAD